MAGACDCLLAGDFSTVQFFKHYRIDLYVHAIEYGILTWLLLHYLQAAGWLERSRHAVWFPLIICAVIGGANEIWQAYVPGRYATVVDELANISGSLVVIAAWLLLKWKMKVKS